MTGEESRTTLPPETPPQGPWRISMRLAEIMADASREARVKFKGDESVGFNTATCYSYLPHTTEHQHLIDSNELSFKDVQKIQKGKKFHFSFSLRAQRFLVERALTTLYESSRVKISADAQERWREAVDRLLLLP